MPRKEDNQHNGSLVLNVTPETGYHGCLQAPLSPLLPVVVTTGLRAQPSNPPLPPRAEATWGWEILWPLMSEGPELKLQVGFSGAGWVGVIAQHFWVSVFSSREWG